MEVSASPGVCDALYRASEVGQLDKVKSIVKANSGIASCSIKWGYTPLHGVVTGRGYLTPDDLVIIKYLISSGAKVEAKAQGGVTPLHITPYPEVVELLVENGASLETTDDSTGTAILFYAESSNGPDSLRKALELGANVHHRDKMGRSALDIAISRNEYSKIRLLKKYGAK